MHQTTLQYDSVRERKREREISVCAVCTVHTKSDRRKTTIKLLLFTFCFELSFVIFSSKVRARSLHLPGLRSVAHVLAFGQIGAFFAHFGCVSKSMAWYFCYILHRAVDTRRSRWTIFIKIFFFWIQRLPFVRKFLFLYRVIHNSTLLHSAHFKDSLYGSVFSRSALFNALVLFTLAFFSIEY